MKHILLIGRTEWDSGFKTEITRWQRYLNWIFLTKDIEVVVIDIDGLYKDKLKLEILKNDIPIVIIKHGFDGYDINDVHLGERFIKYHKSIKSFCEEYKKNIPLVIATEHGYSQRLDKNCLDYFRENVPIENWIPYKFAKLVKKLEELI